MALSSGRQLDQSAAGFPYLARAGAADTLYNNAMLIVNAAGKVIVQGAADGLAFAGFAEGTQVVAADDDVLVRMPDRVWIPHSAAAQVDVATKSAWATDDETVAVNASKPSGGATKIGEVVGVEVGSRVLVDTRRR